MPGLLNSPDNQPQQPAPQQQAPPQQPAPEQSGDMQAQYEKAVEYVERFGAHPQASEQLADLIAGGQSMEEGLGEAAAFTLIRVEAQMQLQDEVKLELIGDILEVVFEIAGEMGVLEESDVNDQLIKSVMSVGTQKYAEMHEKAGMPLDAAGAQAELNELEQSGAINEAREAMPEDADSLDHLVRMARQGG